MRSMSTRLRRAIPSVSALSLALACVATVAVPVAPAYADGGFIRRGAVVSDNGAATRSRVGFGNGEGSGFVGRRGAVSDGSGNALAGFGRCATTPDHAACRGATATRSADGSASRTMGAAASGTAGSASTTSTATRDADGSRSGTRSTEAQGDDYAFSGQASVEDGSYASDRTYSSTEGQSATVENSYSSDQGGSRSVTCINASGAVVECP